MASISARMPTAPAVSTSLHPRLALRDILRLMLFFAIPIYTRFCIISSISSVLGHTCIIGSIGVLHRAFQRRYGQS